VRGLLGYSIRVPSRLGGTTPADATQSRTAPGGRRLVLEAAARRAGARWWPCGPRCTILFILVSCRRGSTMRRRACQRALAAALAVALLPLAAAQGSGGAYPRSRMIE